MLAWVRVRFVCKKTKIFKNVRRKKKFERVS